MTGKETIIEWDEEGKIAKVFTAHQKVARSLKKAGYPVLKQNEAGWWFEIEVEQEEDHDPIQFKTE